ncbi:alkyl hydroperoxide reductase subunit F [Prevotella koreensis]
MIDKDILQQVKSVFASLNTNIKFVATASDNNSRKDELMAFLIDMVSCSDKLAMETRAVDDDSFGFSILREGEPTGISFRGIPNGHEFTSLLLAILNADGQGKNLPDEALRRRISSLKTPLNLRTYVSLTCTNCPEVVQALNVMALINPGISHEMVDGGVFQDEVSRLNIQGVPAVFVGDEQIHIGRGDLGILLQELEDKVGTEHDAVADIVEHQFDVVVVGGGPAGASAAIYSARKGLNVALVAERVGGQVNETVGIENLISVPKTTGNQLSADLLTHIEQYPIKVFTNRQISSVSLKDKEKRVTAKGGEAFVSPAVIIATGAKWRRLGLNDEDKYIGHGIHFCQHCDGPFYKDKSVAVIGGGNSGMEAAIDLAGICSHVTVFEFADRLCADNVLIEKANSMSNIDIHTNAMTTRIIGDGQRLTGLTVKNRIDEKESDYNFDGVFVQIGLAANSDLFADELELSPRREIPIDATCRTSISGVYAAGDVSTVPYKQIVVAMGEGAKAALSAFEDRMRGII